MNIEEFLKQFKSLEDDPTGITIPFEIASEPEKRKQWQLIQSLSMT